MADESRGRQAPLVLVAAIVGKAVWLLWLGWHGLPFTTSDAPCFKQPAYMRLFTSNYSIPSYAGNAPYAELLNSYPSAVYTYANYLTFRLFGFSQYSSIALDLAIHFSIAAIGAWALWRLTHSQLSAVLFVIGSTQWLIPFGRPEEFGVLLVLIALLALGRGRGGFFVALLMLGLTGATSPGAAIVGTALLVVFEGLQRGLLKNRARIASLLAIPVLISLVLYLGYVFPYLSEALQQDRHMRETNLYYRIGLVALVKLSTLWAVGTFPVLLAAIAVGVVGCLRPPGWFPAHTTPGNFVVASGAAVAVGLGLNIVAQRPEYDYRHILAISVASLATVTAWLQTGSIRRRTLAVSLAVLLVALSLPAQRTIVRQSLGLLTWSNDAVRFSQAKAIVNEVVPITASVGGDGNAWTMIDDGRPFLLVRTIAPEFWPDYVISTNWANPPAVMQRPADSHILTEYYQQVPLKPTLPIDGCSLNLPGLRIPLARGRCDWYPTIWKKRDPLAVPKLPQPESGLGSAAPARSGAE